MIHDLEMELATSACKTVKEVMNARPGKTLLKTLLSISPLSLFPTLLLKFIGNGQTVLLEGRRQTPIPRKAHKARSEMDDVGRE